MLVILYDSIVEQFTTFLKNERLFSRETETSQTLGWLQRHQDQGNEGLPQRRRKANLPEEAILLQQLTRIKF